MPFIRIISTILSPFTSGTYMSTLDSLFVICVSILGILSLFLNILLLYLIIYRSPPSLTPYRIFLSNTTITQIVFAIVALVSQPRVISKHTYTIVIYLGPVQYLGVWLSYMSYIAIIHLSLNSFISLMLSMVYRYFSIRFHRFTVRTSVILCVVGYLIPFLILASCSNITVSTDLSTNQQILDNMVDNLEMYNMVVSTNIINQPPIIFLLISVTLGLVPIYTIMYWCRHQIYKTLKRTSSIHSNSTKDNARRLALTIQSIIPLISVFPASMFYCLAQLGIVEPSSYSYCIVPCLTIGCIADPFITIRNVLPYRRWLLKICHLTNSETTTMNEKTKSDVNHTKTGKKIFLI